jgi:hypothetical protein
MVVRRTRWLTWAVVAAALSTAGCAQRNGDIVRVQPNVMKKAELLDGQWFLRNTVTWTPFNTQFTFPGMTGQMEKLVFEIQENYLVGYRSYPFTLGVDPAIDDTSKVSGTTTTACDAKGRCAGGQPYYGSPVVAFPIVSHFDIQRGYNPATGEQTNVISENTTDRPWNQREYMRVNWAANVLNKISGINYGSVLNPGAGVSNSNWIQPNEPGSDPSDWPAFDYEDRDGDGQPELTYFDVTGRYLAHPDTTHIAGWGPVPTCWFADGPSDCSSSEIHLRTSVAKVDPRWSRDYEPLVYGNELMQLFGYFRTERLNWDKKYGYLDSAVVRLAQRHRVWQEYYLKDGDGEPTAQPMPLADRAPKPLVYYFTPASRMGGQSSYDELWEPGRALEQEYDHAFRRAIAAAKGLSIEQVPQMFYLCNNPVTDTDPEVCGRRGLSPRVGDLRYSFINTVTEPVANRLLGIGILSADPETGQIISGNSNTYTWGVNLRARAITDWVLLLSGETSQADYISGASVKAYLQRNPAYTLEQLHQGSSSLRSELTGVPQRDEESRGAFARPTSRLRQLADRVKNDPGAIRAGADEMKRAAEQLATAPSLEAALLDNPDVQNDVLNLLPPFSQAAAAQDPTVLREASKGVLTDITRAQAYERARLDWLSSHSITTADFVDRTLIATAAAKLEARRARITQLQATGNPACRNPQRCSQEEARNVATDEMTRSFRQQLWLATSLHEAGHTIALRHNFQGSFDAVNYLDDYWTLRQPTLTVDQGGQKTLPRTPNDLKAAADGTQSQRAAGLHDYEYSSVMDYHQKSVTDWHGLGKYDEAAILFAYSGTSEPGYVEVFEQARRSSLQFPGSDGAKVTVSGAAVDLPMVNATATNPSVPNYTERFHYSLVPLHFGEGSDLEQVLTDGIAKLRARKLVKYGDVARDEARVREALAADPSLVSDPDRASGVLGTALLRVPYMFCTDESADGPVLSCNRFDRGPDAYEQVRAKLEDYWNYYVDSHFRRDRASFSGDRALFGAFNTFSFVADAYKHWVLEYFRQATPNQQQRPAYPMDATLQDTWTIAVLDGLNQHLNVMAVPPDGLHMYRTLRSQPRWDVISQGVDFDPLDATGRAELQDYYSTYYSGLDYVQLPRGLGRRMYSWYDYKSGYNFFNRMLEAGHYNDQIGAMFAAVIPDLALQGVDLTADRDRYNLPYYLVFRRELQDTFNALWSLDEDKVRPTLYKTLGSAQLPEDDAALFQRVFVKGNDLFTGFDYPPALPGPCAVGQDPGAGNPPKCFVAGQHPGPANLQTTWTSRIYSLYLGMAMFRTNYDLDFAKSNQVFKLGSGEAFTVAPGSHTVEVQDPVVGHRYLAIEVDGAPPDSSGAVRMISIANDYLAMVNDPAKCPLSNFLFYQGYSCLTADQAANPALVEERRRYWLEVFRTGIRDLDLQRGMFAVYGKAF